MTLEKLPRKRGESFTDEERLKVQQIFLDSLAHTGIIRIACEEAGVSRQSVDRWRDNPDFMALYAAAEQDANDLIRKEIRRRAIEGDEQTRTDKQGNEYTVTQRSDTLLIFLAKARMQEFRDTVKQDIDVKGNVGMTIVYAPVQSDT